MISRKRIAVAVGALAILASLGCDPLLWSRFREQLAISADGKTCADGSDYAALVPDCPFEGVCFTSACDAHDACYASCEGTRSECDSRFRAEMFDICNQQFALGDPGQRECLYFANLYWGFVDATGGDYYNCQFVPTEPRSGSCCSFASPPVCQDVTDAPFCAAGAIFISDLTCKDVAETFAGCPTPSNDGCENRRRVCPQSEPDPSLGRCASSDETNPQTANRVCSLSTQDCAFGEACLPREGPTFRCLASGDNRLASTDGPDPGQVCGFGDANRFQGDIWFEYVAPCSGTMTVQLCAGTFYDSVLAVYGSTMAARACECPTTNTAPLTCDDDSCGGFATSSIASTPVFGGGCYTIRVGGYSADASEAGAARGISRIDIGVLCAE